MAAYCYFIVHFFLYVYSTYELRLLKEMISRIQPNILVVSLLQLKLSQSSEIQFLLLFTIVTILEFSFSCSVYIVIYILTGYLSPLLLYYYYYLSTHILKYVYIYLSNGNDKIAMEKHTFYYKCFIILNDISHYKILESIG